MPELPEVETTRRGIAPHIVNGEIICAVVRQPQLRWKVSPEIINIKNQKVLSVQRRAKYLLIELELGWIVIHLGMSGSLRVLTHSEAPAKHDHVDLVLSNGYLLRYTDPRRFGAWLWCESLSQCSQLQHLGPEPLSLDFNSEYLLTRSQNKKTAIKAWIMDNSVVVGVGNIYASESLFKAGILPQRAAGSLTEQEIARLVSTIKQVLAQAIEQGGTTLKDFLQADGKPGYFAQALQVYGRAGERCFCCDAQIIAQKIGQRNTFYCPNCQS